MTELLKELVKAAPHFQRLRKCARESGLEPPEELNTVAGLRAWLKAVPAVQAALSEVAPADAETLPSDTAPPLDSEGTAAEDKLREQLVTEASSDIEAPADDHDQGEQAARMWDPNLPATLADLQALEERMRAYVDAALSPQPPAPDERFAGYGVVVNSRWLWGVFQTPDELQAAEARVFHETDGLPYDSEVLSPKRIQELVPWADRPQGVGASTPFVAAAAAEVIEVIAASETPTPHPAAPPALPPGTVAGKPGEGDPSRLPDALRKAIASRRGGQPLPGSHAGTVTAGGEAGRRQARPTKQDRKRAHPASALAIRLERHPTWPGWNATVRVGETERTFYGTTPGEARQKAEHAGLNTEA